MASGKTRQRGGRAHPGVVLPESSARFATKKNGEGPKVVIGNQGTRDWNGCGSRVWNSPNLCNLGKAYAVHILGRVTPGGHAGASLAGVACRRGGRTERGREGDEVMVYRPFSYLSATFQLSSIYLAARQAIG